MDTPLANRANFSCVAIVMINFRGNYENREHNSTNIVLPVIYEVRIIN